VPVDVLYSVGRLAMGTVAIWAGAEKLLNLSAFVRGVRSYDLLPRRVSTIAAGCIVATEITLGTLLVLDIAVSYAAAAAAALFGLFAVAIATDLTRGVRVPCHCFGEADAELLSSFSLARAGLLALTSAAVSVLASTGVTGPRGEMLLPTLTLAAAVVVTTRLVGLIPTTLETFAAKPIVSLTGRHRTSLRTWPLEPGLRIVAPRSADLISLEAVPRVPTKTGGSH